MNESPVQPGQQPSPKLYLALSGGGFRATIFHMGVIRYLRDYGLLSDVLAISSVSGGSLTAAHVVLNWADYNADRATTFEQKQNKIRELTKIGLRERLVKRRFWYWLLSFFKRVSITLRFANYLHEHLFTDHPTLVAVAQAHQDKKAPRLIIMTTNLTQHSSRTSFNNSEYVVETDENGTTTQSQKLRISGFPVAQAVAASAAFPFFFPPLEFGTHDPNVGIRQEDLGARTHLLTDGGLFENLGVSVLRDLVRDATVGDAQIIVSDAGLRLDWDLERRSSRRWLRTLLRSSEIVHYWSERRLGAGKSGELLVRISKHIDGSRANDAVQSAVARLRTDFDYFSNVEWTALLSKGYETAREALGGISPKQPVVRDAYDPWPSDVADWSHPSTVGWLDRGRWRRWRPWRGVDPYTFLHFGLVVIAIVLVSFMWTPAVRFGDRLVAALVQEERLIADIRFDEFAARYESARKNAFEFRAFRERWVGEQVKWFADVRDIDNMNHTCTILPASRQLNVKVLAQFAPSTFKSLLKEGVIGIGKKVVITGTIEDSTKEFGAILSDCAAQKPGVRDGEK